MLASLTRSLHQLTVRHHLCTLVTNSIVGVQSSSHPQYEYHRRKEDNVSIFASIVGKPALGSAFAHLVDTSILLSTLPKTREDAESAYGNDRGDTKFARAGVLEVLKDRNGTRAEKWAAFDIKSGADIRAIQLRPY